MRLFTATDITCKHKKVFFHPIVDSERSPGSSNLMVPALTIIFCILLAYLLQN